MSINLRGSFRMPNSIIHTLTEVEKDGPEDLSGLAVVVLLGMFSKIDSKAPGEYVYTNFSNLMESIGEIKSCSMGTVIATSGRGYDRFSPKTFKDIKGIIDLIFNIRYCKIKPGSSGYKESWLPVFTEYGYEYRSKEGAYDLDNLPEDLERVNACEWCDRPIYKVRKKSGKYLAPCRFFFRLEPGLVAEIGAGKNTLYFTRISGKIFSLLKKLGRTKTMVRLVLLILRQTKGTFNRRLGKLLGNLGFDFTHKSESISYLNRMLEDLKSEQLIRDFNIEGDSLSIEWNKNFFF